LQQPALLGGLQSPEQSLSGSDLFLMKSHTPLTPPFVFIPSHDAHVPVHAVSQQYLVPPPSSGQKPLAHWPALVHVWPLNFLHTLLPSHAWVVLQLATCWPAGTLMHVPMLPARSHRAQSPEQELLQQRPSWQKPLRQAALLPQGSPSLALQVPEPSHALVPEQPATSTPLVTGLQVPTLLARLQATQTPGQAALQHVVSSQMPPRHSPAIEHGEPCGLAHWPAPLHASAPAHSLAGSCPLGIGEQMPMLPVPLHRSHRPPQAVLQHTPSTQFMVVHWEAFVQAFPVPDTTLQVFVPVSQ
jgi:hypothetical protein